MGWSFTSALLSASGSKKIGSEPEKPKRKSKKQTIKDPRQAPAAVLLTLQKHNHFQPTLKIKSILNKKKAKTPKEKPAQPQSPPPLETETQPSPLFSTSPITTTSPLATFSPLPTFSPPPSFSPPPALFSPEPTFSPPPASPPPPTSEPPERASLNSPSTIDPKLSPVPLKRLSDDNDYDPLRKKSRSKPGLLPIKRSNKSQYTNIPLPELDFELRYVVKGYAESDKSPACTWHCEFEPNSDMVAICGSNSVLFLDTEVGEYKQKYIHSEINEIFYTMAWTTLTTATPVDDEDDGVVNVLAVAGQLGTIKLLNTKKNECYRCLFGHHRLVRAVAFSKKQPSWLFSASDDRAVRLWNIGTFNLDVDDSFCLAKFLLPDTVGSPTSISVSHDLSMIIVGTDTGDIVDFEIKDTLLESFYKQTKDAIKMAVVNTAFIWPHGDEWHEGYIDDVCILGQDGVKENSMFNKIVSRGEKDMEMIVWDPYMSTDTDAAIDIALHWPDSGGTAGLKFKVVEVSGQKVLLAGDYTGQIYIYDIGNGVRSRDLPDNSKEQIRPEVILKDELSTLALRDVCCSSDTQTIVAVDAQHTVYIWKT